MYVVWVMCVSVCAALAQDDPYCSVRYERLCQGKGPHVACQYPYRGSGPSCENYTAIIFSNDLKQFVLHYINRRRQKIASGHERVRGGVHLPKPEIMMLVQWDRELAYLAQRLADQCQFVHDDCRATVRYPYAGQTVGEVRWRRSGSSLERGARRTIGRVLDAWWGERRRVQAKQLISPFVLTARGAVWGHFSQLAVWSLRGMGCGAVHHGATRPRLLLVCDFSHTNMLGQRTISPGPLAPCPLHTVRAGRPYPLLCAPPPVHHTQEIGDNIEEDDEEEPAADDDEEPDDEEVDTRRSSIPEGPDAYPTRPWPNRPVRPIIHDDTMDTDNQPVRQQHRTVEAIIQSTREHHRIDDVDQPKLSYRLNVDSQTREYAYNRPATQQYRITDLNYFTVKDQLITMENNQLIRQYTTDDGQPERPQYKPIDIDRIRPIQDVRPIKNVRPIQVTPINPEDDDDRYVQPSQDDVVDTDRSRSTEVEALDTERPGQMKYDFKDVDQPIRPVIVDVVDRDERPVVPISDGLVNSFRRPMIPDQEEEDDTWRQSTVKQRFGVSVKYRDNTDSLFRQKLNDELNSRNHELDFQNGQPMRNGELETKNRQSETRNREPEARYREPEMTNRDSDMRNRNPDMRIKKPEMRMKGSPRYVQSVTPLQKTETHRSSEMRRKGEYKAHSGNRRIDLEMNRGPLQIERWRDDQKDMSAVLPLRQPVQQVTAMVVYRPTSLFSIQTDPVSRQRWVQTRVRPRRPGASALFQTSNPIHVVRQSKASMVLDKDEEEQLYHDTGFSVSTRNR